jgi:hypothetical protein
MSTPAELLIKRLLEDEDDAAINQGDLLDTREVTNLEQLEEILSSYGFQRMNFNWWRYRPKARDHWNEINVFYRNSDGSKAFIRVENGMRERHDKSGPIRIDRLDSMLSKLNLTKM